MKTIRIYLFIISILGVSQTMAQSSITSSTNGVLCSGTPSILNVNLVDDGSYPGIPADPRLKHYTYEWFRNGKAVLGAAKSSFEVKQDGDYFVTVSEYPQELQADGSMAWATIPDNISSSNSIKYDLISGGSVIAGFTLDEQVQSPTEITNFFKCNPILLTDASQMGTVTGYMLEIMDENFDKVIYSTGEVYTSGPRSLDLTQLCTGSDRNCSVFGEQDFSGVYGIRYTVTDKCFADYTSVFTSLVYVSAKPSGNSIEARTVTTSPALEDTWYSAVNSSVNNPDDVGRKSTIFNFSGVSYRPSPAICSYTVSLQPWNGSSWDPAIWSATHDLNCAKGNLVQLPIEVIGGNQFFEDPANAPDNSIWRINVRFYNPCGSYSTHEVIRITETSFD